MPATNKFSVIFRVILGLCLMGASQQCFTAGEDPLVSQLSWSGGAHKQLDTGSDDLADIIRAAGGSEALKKIDGTPEWNEQNLQKTFDDDYSSTLSRETDTFADTSKPGSSTSTVPGTIPKMTDAEREARAGEILNQAFLPAVARQEQARLDAERAVAQAERSANTPQNRPWYQFFFDFFSSKTPDEIEATAASPEFQRAIQEAQIQEQSAGTTMGDAARNQREQAAKEARFGGIGSGSPERLNTFQGSRASGFR